MSSDKLTFHTLFARLVNFHVLRDAKGLYLVDAGFIGAIPQLEKYLTEIDQTFGDIRAILITHGHLDHTLNVAKIQERSGCRVYAPANDRHHISGTHHYRGASRLCGIAESLGRFALRYRPPQVDHWFQPGEILKQCWGGLEVIPLPGHTAGHSGFLSRQKQTLFAGDLFSAYGTHPKPPPHFLNTAPRQAHASIVQAATLGKQRELTAVVLNHSRATAAESHLHELKSLAEELAR